MCRRFENTTLKGLFAVLVVVSFAFLSGCGNIERSPLMSSSADPVQEELSAASNTNSADIASSPTALRAGKKAASDEPDPDSSTTTQKGKSGGTTKKSGPSRYFIDD